MKKASQLPKPVRNLRRIWDKKKAEMNFTQVQAAKELGWSQGAISHYLNAITDLGPPAVIKLANFLGVAPTDIDPDVVKHLPNVQSYNVTRTAADLTKVINRTVYVTPTPSEKNVVCPAGTKIYGNSGETVWTDEIVLRTTEVKDSPDACYFLVVKKGAVRAHFYHRDVLPPSSSIKKILAIEGCFHLTRGHMFEK
jgi:transcriptional regulator with XRE-family HTH domain